MLVSLLSAFVFGAGITNTTEFVYLRLLLLSFTWFFVTDRTMVTVKLKSIIELLDVNILLTPLFNASLICAYIQYKHPLEHLSWLAISACVLSYSLLLPSIYSYFYACLQQKHPNHISNDICMAIFTLIIFHIPFISYGHIVSRATSAREASINLTYINILTLILVNALRGMPYVIVYILIAGLGLIYYLVELKRRDFRNWETQSTFFSVIGIVIVYCILRFAFSYNP